MEENRANWMARVPVEVYTNYLLPYLSYRDLRVLHAAGKGSTILQSHLQNVWRSYHYDCTDVVSKSRDIAWLSDIGIKITGVALGHFRNVKERDSIMAKITTPYLKRFRCGETLPCAIMHQLANTCPNLEELLVSCHDENHYSDYCILAFATSCRQLHTLEWTTGNGYRVLQLLLELRDRLRNLRHFICKDAFPGDLLKDVIRAYPFLQSIHLHHNAACPDDWKRKNIDLLAIADNCRELKSVTVTYFCDRHRNGFDEIWAANPNLTDIDISHGSFVEYDMLKLARCCRQLQKLNLTKCSNITDIAVMALAERCPQLTSLSISFCEYVHDEALIALGRNCPFLQEFQGMETRISDYGVSGLAHGCRDLRKINLSGCNLISEYSISAIAENCPLISELQLIDCGSINDACLNIVAEHCHNLTTLSVQCTAVSYKALIRFFKENPAINDNVNGFY